MTISESESARQNSGLSIGTALFNPFHYLAGGPALGLGLGLILLTGVVGYFGNTHMDGVIDSHTGRPAALWVFLAEGIVDWVALTIPLYIAGRLLSRSHGVRALDVIGTQALARAPYALVAFAALLPGFQRVTATLAENLRSGIPPNGDASTLTSLTENMADFTVFLGVTVFGLLMLVWMVALMYRAYAHSFNLKGARAIISFIIAIVVAEFASKIGVNVLFVLERSAAG